MTPNKRTTEPCQAQLHLRRVLRGTADISLRMRRILNDRRIDNGPVVGGELF